MAPAFSREAILQGSIDCLCLVCESYLRSERDVCLHVSTPEHRQNLDSTDYVDKYRHDRIRKVKKWYHCEFCNVLVSTITAVGLHVKEASHIATKSKEMARVSDVIVTENTVISEAAWHGFVDDNTCTICDVEYEDQNVHKEEPTHVINLIQSKVNNNSYRVIDDSTFHCLTCNEVVAEITAHIDDPKHKQVLQRSFDQREKNTKLTHTHDKDLTSNSKSVHDNRKPSSDILDSIPKFQKNNININFESRTAVCRKCSMNIKFTCKDIEQHIEEHEDKKMNKTETDPNKFESESPVPRSPEQECDEAKTNPIQKTEKSNDHDNIHTLANQHGLTYVFGDNTLFCPLCNKNIPAAVKNITDHVNGHIHKSRRPANPKNDQSAKKANKCNLLRVPSHQFIQDVNIIITIASEDAVVNDKYCISVLSFFYYTKLDSRRYRCQVCEVNLSPNDINAHLQGGKHKRAMNEIPVLIRTDLEFIREIRSGIFQCGYCNIYDDWRGMEDHLQSTDHNRQKCLASWRLSQYSPQAQLQIAQQFQAFLQLLLS